MIFLPNFFSRHLTNILLIQTVTLGAGRYATPFFFDTYNSFITVYRTVYRYSLGIEGEFGNSDKHRRRRQSSWMQIFIMHRAPDQMFIFTMFNLK